MGDDSIYSLTQVKDLQLDDYIYKSLTDEAVEFDFQQISAKLSSEITSLSVRLSTEIDNLNFSGTVEEEDPHFRLLSSTFLTEDDELKFVATDRRLCAEIESLSTRLSTEISNLDIGGGGIAQEKDPIFRALSSTFLTSETEPEFRALSSTFLTLEILSNALSAADLDDSIPISDINIGHLLLFIHELAKLRQHS